MRCPVCGKEMASLVCGCGYDESRYYEKYPALGRLPGGVVSVSGLRNRVNNLVRCGGCGGYAFTLNRHTGALACSGCGRALTQGELKPLTDALGLKKEEKAPVGQNDGKTGAAKQEDAGRLRNVIRTQPSNGKNPKQIVSIAVGWHHTAALYADGTVAAIGDSRNGKCDVSSWRDIVAISAGYSCTTGLKKDGTVVQTGGGDYQVKYWKDIVAITNGNHHTVGLKRDGTVVAAGYQEGGRCAVSGWRNIQAIAAGDSFTLGLEKSGRVVVAGKADKIKKTIQEWKNIKAIAAGYDHCAALDIHGNILIAGSTATLPAGSAPVAALDAGGYYTIALREDGTAASAGVNTDRRCDVGKWKDLTKIASAYQHTVGLKKDGTLVATGDNVDGQCDVDKLMRK